MEDYECEGISRIADRFPSASIRILSSNNYQHMVGDNLYGKYDEEFDFEKNVQPFLDDLRSKELTHFITHSDALLSTTPQYLFRLPSGVFAEYFLRVGNIQTTRHNLDSLFFWMLPYLRDVKGILVDTWSIGSIALNCSRLLTRYDHVDSGLVRVEMRNSYVDGKADTRPELEELVKRASNEFTAPFLFLISAAMTGHSLENFYSAIFAGDCPQELLRSLILFRLADNQIQINNEAIPELCNLATGIPMGVAIKNKTSRTIIEIDRTTYFPGFVKEKEVRLLKSIASKNHEFFSSYRLSNAIRIHADSKIGGHTFRHHGIYIDVTAMAVEERFGMRLQAILEGLEPPPQMILIPPHEAGEVLAQTVVEHFAAKTGNFPHIVKHIDLNLSGDVGERKLMCGVHNELRAYTEDDAIMVLDDVATTGERLSTYQKRLRDIGYKGRIHYLVGVQRMPSSSEWTELEGSLRANKFGPPHTTNSVENVALPNWDHESCPLCIERELLNGLLKNDALDLSDWILRRAQLLRNSVEDGLTEGIFFQSPNRPALRLTINSYFSEGDSPQSVVLSAVAAAIQEIREHKDPLRRLDSRGFPVRTVLAIGDLYRYSDGILRAAILRSLIPEEIQRSTHSKEILLIKWAKMLLAAKDGDELTTQPELALAIGLGKVPVEAANEEIRKQLAELHLDDLLPIIDARKY